VIILGGLGSIGGALAAAVLMLTAEAIVDIWYPTWSVAVFYAALVVVLTFRPQGLFGRREARAQ
jgi:branched-chain amino acid transport system permease protein